MFNLVREGGRDNGPLRAARSQLKIGPPPPGGGGVKKFDANFFESTFLGMEKRLVLSFFKGRIFAPPNSILRFRVVFITERKYRRIKLRLRQPT